MQSTVNKWLMGLLIFGFAVGPSLVLADDDTPQAAAVAKKGADLVEIRARAESMPVDRRVDIDKRVAATISGVNGKAEGKGYADVATRLAREFGVSTDALLDDKARCGFSWGEMVIAHTLMANSAEPVTLADLATLRSNGLGWAAIAFGLKFHLEDLEETIKTEGKVAMGLAKPGSRTVTTEK